MPLFRDPVYDGATDPVLVRNRAEGSWWLLYTARRPPAPTDGVGWVHGSDIGVASSLDAGLSWTYRGTLQGLEHEFGRNTFWAPEFIWHDNVCHMFVSYVRGIPEEWAGHERHIHHYSSADMVSWTHHGALELASDYVIDACIFPLPTGGFRMWYKNEADDNSTWSSDSSDLFQWHGARRALATATGHEGPNVFRFRNEYWMVVDSWAGQMAFRSSDLHTWVDAGRVLGDEMGSRIDDVGPGLHADVVVDGDRAFIVYFTHPDRGRDSVPRRARRSSILVAELEVTDGVLACDRDRDMRLQLSNEAG